MRQRYFIDIWLLRCERSEHGIANQTSKNGLRHFSALPFCPPYGGEEILKCDNLLN